MSLHLSCPEVEYLFERMQMVAPYPQGVAPVPGRIEGTAFFPGGNGLWRRGNVPPPKPVGGVMILGHNFDTRAGFERSRMRVGENLLGETWRNLLRLIDQSGIPRERCFFTNAYMGLIDGPRAMGRFPGARDARFVARCQAFLLEQIRVMQPRLILTLGMHVLPFIAPLSPDLHSWRGIHNFRTLDERGKPLIYPATFDGLPRPAAVIALTHPALRMVNVRRRRYRGIEGEEAERALVADGLERAQFGMKEAVHVPAQA